jgi:hypothetical protein
MNVNLYRQKQLEKLQQRLDYITAKSIGELRKDEIGFLKARITYLTLEQREKFSQILKPSKINNK